MWRRRRRVYGQVSNILKAQPKDQYQSNTKSKRKGGKGREETPHSNSPIHHHHHHLHPRDPIPLRSDPLPSSPSPKHYLPLTVSSTSVILRFSVESGTIPSASSLLLASSSAQVWMLLFSAPPPGAQNQSSSCLPASPQLRAPAPRTEQDRTTHEVSGLYE